METYWSKRIRSLEAYVPGEQPGGGKYLKLNTNENPYPPSPKVLEAIRNAADASLRLYPDPVCGELRETIAGHYGLKKDEVFVGNGSDEVLSFAFAAFFDGDRPVLFPDITYSFYPVYANFYGIPFRTVPLRGVPAEELFRLLKERKVLVRYFRKPRIDNHLRVSVGTDEDMERFVATVKVILEE